MECMDLLSHQLNDGKLLMGSVNLLLLGNSINILCFYLHRNSNRTAILILTIGMAEW